MNRCKTRGYFLTFAAHLYPAFPEWELAPCQLRLLRHHRALPSVFLDKQFKSNMNSGKKFSFCEKL
ncbi:hypothetical protein CA2015_3006 [Cyclobacterium amurskyense]|uniref:Uncharacterized protein n=1 Tax=Cyclobacterium amurskyense TaxID=320787 RepID=A0A0H4PH88_9BACT|nr:hypothetical protein CA2015_3006 [Cyclobacterium amurskyense]